MKAILLTTAVLIASISVFAQPSNKPSFTIGSEVTDYPEVQWVKGTPVTKFDKNKIYIVECWATWCYPCVQSIPHLNALNNKFKDKIVIIGQNVWEDGQENVEKFVKDKGDGMGYNVAFSGGKESQFADKWLKPAGLNGIPATFVIQDNKIVWQPHPADLSEEALQMLVDRKFNAEAAEAFSPIKKMNEIQALIDADKLAEAAPKLDAMLQKDPRSEYLNSMKVDLLKKQGKDAESLAFAKSFYDKYPDEGKNIYYGALMEAKDYSQLLAITDKAIKKNPEDVGAIVMRYQIFSEQKDVKSAVDMIREMTASNNMSVLTSLAFLNQHVRNGLKDPQVENAMLEAGKKGLSIKPTSIQLMIAVTKLQWAKDKAAAKATAAKTNEALKNDPKLAQAANLAMKVLASLEKDEFPTDKQLNEWYNEGTEE